MELLLNVSLFLDRVALAAAFVLILVAPAWWLAGRIQEATVNVFFRFLCAIGLAMVGYLSFVNLLGRLVGHSIAVVVVYLAMNLMVGVFLWRRRPGEFTLAPLASSWRRWIGPVLIAIVLGMPQWLLAVSTPFWDEVASSAIHVTAVNQFAEDMFPPRHNALPNVPIKYHYAVTILSGTVKWLSGLSANVSIDIVSTGLWLFAFLFVYFWFRELDFDAISAFWGGCAALLGGGLGWLYLPRTEAYNGIEKVPPPSELLQRYDPAKSWLANLIADGHVPSAHLRNADGSLSALPWDIAAQFQQHATALGMALTLVALYLFVTWQKRKDVPLLVGTIVTFGVLFLCHAVFGAVAAVTAGLCLVGSWLREPTRAKFYQGVAFTSGTSILAFLHGGLLARGAEYGASSDVMALRDGFGYATGGASGFLHWNVAGFGLPLILAIAAWGFYLRDREHQVTDRNLVFLVLTVFAAFSYLVPQLVYYTTETNGVEQFTEISKFFFSAHFGFALLSVFGVAYLRRSLHSAVLAPGFVAMAITPLVFCYANSVNAGGSWLGFYRAPYFRASVEQQMGETLGRLKKSNRDVYFDASADENRHGYLSEMLIFGGSAFTLTPSRYERTGIGYRLSQQLVARRYVQNGRMARLLPGAAEDCDCTWYYSRPVEDMAFAPLIVRSRFDKLVAEGYFVKRFEAGARALYSIDKATSDLDQGIEKYWRPRIVSQTKVDFNGDGQRNLIFFDYVNHRILSAGDSIDLPEWLHGEFVQLYTASFPGDPKVDFLFGRLKDTEFRLGKTLEDLVQRDAWGWTYRDSASRVWQPEYEQWLWTLDVPFIADIDHDGFDNQLAYRRQTGEWLMAPDRTLNGPAMPLKDFPLPFGGRFLDGSSGDLGLWAVRTGMITLQTLTTGRSVSFKWGGREGDVLVPGDYDGDGYDEIAVWQRTNHTWYWRRAPEGPVSQATFGTDSGVPIPADYNNDGRVDLAYWEPLERKIVVSLDLGKSVALTIPVPPNSLPAYVNMY